MSAALTLRSVRAGVQASRTVVGRPAAGLREQERQAPAEVAFYRKYTEGMLRRYMYRSMEIGRAPSLLGDFSFRGRASSRRARSFEDAVIFVHDVERCLKRLDAESRELVKRIALQEYTQGETAQMLGMSVRSVVRKYGDALDRLTALFLERELLEVPSWR